MSENEKLLKLCLEAPADLVRLHVYSDWLEEQGDIRGAYTREQLALRRAPAAQKPAHRRRARALYPVEHPAWCGRFEQAGVFDANLLEVPDLWWGVSLGERASSGTYQGFEYARQPPLPVEHFDGRYTWLARAPLRTSYSPEGDDTGWRQRLDALRLQGFNVPTAFETLLLDADLQRRVPSCTDNSFLSGERAEVHHFSDEACFVTFYTDSQSCVLWGLRLGKGNDHYAPVLAGAPEFPEEDDNARQPFFSFPELTFNAPTIEAFAYRWWLENSIWFATESEPRPLTDEEQRYLDFLEASR